MRRQSREDSPIGGKTASAFRKLRTHITIVPTVLIFIVLGIMFSLSWTAEYQSRVDSISRQMSLTVFLEENGGAEADAENLSLFDDLIDQDPYIFGHKEEGRPSNRPSNKPSDSSRQEESESQQASSKPREIGENSPNTWETYLPIVVYRIDYPANDITPISGDGYTLSNASWKYATDNLIRAEYGFGRVEQGSLFYQKSHLRNYDVLAFTDSSALDTRMATLRDNFMMVTLAVSFITAVLAWLLSAVLVRPLTESWAKQRRFIADASHELKTPIAVIMANSAIILEGGAQDPESVRKWTQATQDEADKLNMLVADMLYLATNDSEKEVLMSEFNYSKVVMKLAMSSESRAFEKGCSVEYGDIEKNIMVYGEEAGLTRLASVLLDNACKYCHDDTVIEVKLTQGRKHITLSVADDGDVIDPETLKSLFDRFYRADKSRTGDNGYGLGLAMARDIAERHGGSVGVESNDGHTVFTAKLPKKAS